MKYLLFLLPALLLAEQLSELQINNYRFGYTIAANYTNYPTTIMAIYRQETSLGADPRRVGDDGKSFGIMQIQIPTVRWLAEIYEDISWLNSFSDEAIKHILVTRDDFSIILACYYFEHYRKHWGYRRAVMMYNGGVNNWTYFNSVERHKQNLLRYKSYLK